MNWLKIDVEKLDRKTRKILIGSIHHPKANVETLYIKRRNGARGLLELESALKFTAVELRDYLDNDKTWTILLKVRKMTC